MRKRTILSFISIFMILCLLPVSCASSSGKTETEEVNASIEGTEKSSSGLTGKFTSVISGWISDEEARTTVVPSSDQMPSTYSSEDYIFNADDYVSVSINLSSLKSSYLDGAVTVEEKKKKTTITITEDGKYNIVLSGESMKGVTVVSENSDYMLTLDGVSITSCDGSDEQALKMKSTTTCFMVLMGENSLTGCTETETNAVKAAGSLVITGDGILNVYAVTKNGIVSDDVIVINSGNISVTLDSTTSGGTGIKSVNGYVQNGGSVTVTGLNMTQGMENKGIKVDGDEEETEYGRGKGYILINGGEIVINTSGKGISAGFDPTEDGDTSSSVNDPSADVYINNGLITVNTYAAVREDSTPEANDGVSPEGIEGKRSLTINGGKIIVNTTDDSLNSSEDGNAAITINGGLVYAHSSENDAVDSNGTITVTGGVLIALGTGVPEGGIDCDSDSRFTYTGGTVIAMGGTNQNPLSSSSTGYYLYSGMSMNISGGFDFGGMTPPGGFGGETFTKPENLAGGEAMTPPDLPSGDTFAFQKPQGDDSSVPAKPEGDDSSQSEKPEGVPEMPQNGFGGGKGPMEESKGQGEDEIPSLPDGVIPEKSEGKFEGFQMGGSLSSGETIALLDGEGNVILAFTLPQSTVSSSILIASDALGEGTYTLSKAASVQSEYSFASSLSFGSTEVAVESSESVRVSEKGTKVNL